MENVSAGPGASTFGALFAKLKVTEIPPNTKNMVIVLSLDSALSDACKTFYEARIHAAPLYDVATRTYVAFLDVADVCAFVVNNIFAKEEPANIHEKRLPEYKRAFQQAKVSEATNASLRDPFVEIFKDASVSDAIESMVAAHAHRIIIRNERSRDQLVNLLTQSQLLSFASNRLHLLGQHGNKTLRELGLGARPVISVPETETALNAFRRLIQERVSGIAIVKDKTIVGHLSVWDILGIGADANNLGGLLKPVREYVESIQAQKIKATSKVIQCKPEESIHNLIVGMALDQVGRVYVVNEKDELQGVVAREDVLRQLLHL